MKIEMSSVKALPVGHTTPMYVVMESTYGLKKNNAHWTPHESGGQQYKRPQLPGSPVRGYQYPPEPHRTNSTSSHHPAAANSIYAAPNHLYRDSHFQVDSRQPQPQQSEVHSLERYAEHQQHHARRRLSLRPTPEYVAGIERERFMEQQMRYHYEREVAMNSPFVNAPAAVPRGIKPLVVSVHTPSELEMGQSGKRPRLAVEPKAPVHQPLTIDTRNIKKEPAYTPQVEAISPTLPSEEGRSDSPMRVLKENILGSINRLDKEISQIESQVNKRQKKLQELELEASKPTVSKEIVKDNSQIESKQMSIAQIIYSDNRGKALESHEMLEKLGPKVEVPMYNQPSDTAIYHENKRKFITFKSRLTSFFKKRHREKELREAHLTDTYSKLMQEWLKKMEKKENNAAKKAKDAKLREFFEKQFPELKKQREDKERITRVSQRIRSDAEWEEIIDGLQEQELEEKKMRSYAVIPPIRLDTRQRRMWYVNRNGLIEDLSQEYKEKQMLNIWTDQEKDIFREKYLQHPKNFSLIASCLERKTVADCIQYYYLTKKSENYKQLLRKHSVRKRTRALVKGPQPPQTGQNSGITTRQQEEKSGAVNLSVAGGCLANSDSIVTTATDPSLNHAIATSMAITSSLMTSSSSSTLLPPLTASGMITSTERYPKKMDLKSSEGDKEKHLLPNNVRKKKEASKKVESSEKGTGSDSDTASDHRNENGPIQSCTVCKTEIDNINQSRVLTKSNCGMFGIKESDLIPDMRVCSSCRFKSVRRRCPIPTCKTPKRKVKRLRPLPTKLVELMKDPKSSQVAEFQIPPDVNKCCSACFNRITRKLDNNAQTDNEPADNSRWNEEETDNFKKGLKQFGTDWEAIAGLVNTKTHEQCRNFYFNYKRKLGLEELLKGKQSESNKDGAGDKPPPIVTDEEESGETTSSCDEDNCVDRCSSDTASAPSPVEKIMNEVKATEEVRPPPPFLPSSTATTPEVRPQPLPPPVVDASPKGQTADYDSSATVSADEGQNQNENELRENSPCVNPTAPQLTPKLPLPNDKLIKPYNNPPLLKDLEARAVEANVPLVKTLLQDPNIGAGHSTDLVRPSYLDQPPAKTNPKEEPTCVRDLIYQAIEMSLQWPAKPGRNNNGSPVPNAMVKDSTDIVHMEPKKEFAESSTSVPIPPTAHCSSRRPSRPGSKHSDAGVSECEVQDLSKKSRCKDSPPQEYIKRDRIAPPARPPSESSNSSSHGHYYGAPPPAHCNQYRAQPPPPALSPHYGEPHHDTYYPRGSEPRSKGYSHGERPHSQLPHLIAQTSSTMASTPPLQSHQKPIISKPSVPPPPPLIASKPTQLSPKLSYKERMVSIPPAGSITQGTPVNQQPGSAIPTTLKYEGFLRQLPPPQTKDGGSITLGTPVQHDQSRRIPTSRSDIPPHIAASSVYDPAVVEYFRHVPSGGQPYPFPPGVPGYPGPGGGLPARPPYVNESQLSSKQIIIDFNTSKQMLRRGITGDKEIKVSPRGSESSPAPSEPHLHPMYPPVNYQSASGPPFANQLSAGYPAAADSRFALHRAQMEQSASGNDSPVNACFPHPGKRSPGIAQGASRQNVIHRSITWGTAKPSVIQAPQSSSPRTSDGHSESLSPAMARKSTPSPRNPQPMIYQQVPPSGHDAFNTLVNAAVAQPSLVIPKDGKGSPGTRQDTKSPRDRPVVEGLEKTLIDMHQRPRSFTESGMRNSSHSSHNEHGRLGNEHPSLSESQRPVLGITPDGHRYVTTVPHPPFDISRETPQHILVNEHSPTSIRLSNMREPFSREQFERQMRQSETSRERDRHLVEKEHERHVKSDRGPNIPGHVPHADMENEASKIFSQSFQKDAPRSGSSPRGFTAANLIDAIITRQINQNVEAGVVPKGPSAELFNQYHPNYEGQKQRMSKSASRAEIVTIDDEPDNEKANWNERPRSHGRSPPVSMPSASNSLPVVPIPYTADKVVTLGEHIAAIISKDYNSPSDGHPPQSFFGNVQIAGAAGSSRGTYIPGGTSHSNSGKQLEGIAAALPTEGILANSRDTPDHSPQNCPGNGCTYHTHSWKLRRALQQDKEREHRSPASEGSHSRPVSAQTAGSPIGQDERQIIRVSQTSSPAVQTSPVTPYVEPISPPSQPTDSPTSIESSSGRNISKTTMATTWTTNQSITGLLATRQIFSQDYPNGLPPPGALYSGAPPPLQPNSGSGNRPPQQQMGLSPLDYVKNRIVEVMRTATDDVPEGHESRRSHSSHAEERDQHAYKFQMMSDREPSVERPCSTGSGIPQMQSQRYSPAVSRYSPIPPRPSSAAERVPSRNSTPSELQRHHKRSLDTHHMSAEWHESGKIISRSMSPNAHEKDVVPRKKMRSDSTFIPESTVDHAPVLVPENSTSISRPASHSEPPRLSINSQDTQDFRSTPRSDNPWDVDRATADRLSTAASGASLSTSVEAISPPSRENSCASKNSDSGSRTETNNAVSSSNLGLVEPSRSSPGTSQRNGASSISGHFPSYSVSSSSSNNTTFSSSSCLPPPANPHLAFSSFSGMNTTYAYPYSALTMRSLAVANTSPPVTVAGSTHVSPIPVSNPSSTVRNSPSPLSRSNQPPPLLSSQYEPLSDED